MNDPKRPLFTHLAVVLFLLMAALTYSCGSSSDPANNSSKKEKTEHFPFSLEDFEGIANFLIEYPQIEELGYVFKDHEFLNEELIVFDKKINLNESIIVNWIDFKNRKYTDEDYYPAYYKEVLATLKIDDGDFDDLYGLMKKNYIEGVINEAERKYLFLNKPMGTFKGFVHAKDGRKGLGESIFMNDIQLRVVKEFGGNWFGFVYP